jgi:hypothetical protein
MTESAFSTARGAEISERSTELVLPDSTVPESREPIDERNLAVKQSDKLDQREFGQRDFESANPTTRAATTPKSALPSNQAGRPLPGDRGRQNQQTPKERPSFWRRIALGRRGAKARDGQQTDDDRMLTAPTKFLNKPKDPLPQTNDSIERRIVEPMLQALVSVEAKLERSHIELVGRSDQVEQRLTQLWDIEEQLGTLGELQESLLQISEQQRRLESALVIQNRTLRWLIGTVLFSIATAAFIVAAVLR